MGTLDRNGLRIVEDCKEAVLRSILKNYAKLANNIATGSLF